MRSKRLRLSAIGLIVAVSLSLTACGGEQDDDDNDGGWLPVFLPWMGGGTTHHHYDKPKPQAPAYKPPTVNRPPVYRAPSAPRVKVGK